MTCKCSGIMGPRDLAAVCHTCIWGEARTDDGASDWWTAGGFTHCSISGLTVMQHAHHRNPCPKGKHDGKYSRWFGVRTLGLPALNRWWIWMTHHKHPAPRSFVGCGCFAALKSLYTRMTKKEPGNAHR